MIMNLEQSSTTYIYTSSYRLGMNKQVQPITDVYGNEMVAMIRNIIKSGHGKTLSVKRGRGTAYGWIDISGSGKWGEFTELEREHMAGLGFDNMGGNHHGISPEERRYLAKVWGLLKE